MRGKITKSFSYSEFEIDVGLDTRRIRVNEELNAATGKPFQCRIAINGKVRPDGAKDNGQPFDVYTVRDLRAGDFVEVDGNPAVRIDVTRA